MKKHKVVEMLIRVDEGIAISEAAVAYLQRKDYVIKIHGAFKMRPKGRQVLRKYLKRVARCFPLVLVRNLINE